MSSTASDAARERLGTRHWVFIGSMVALDFAFGFLFKHALNATGISSIVRLDMAVPVALMMLTRLTVDRFGVSAIYEVAWATLAIFGLPNAIMPGPLKLLPALAQGLMYDAAFSLLPRWPRARVFASAILGSVLSSVMVVSLRVWVLGYPWANVTKALFGIRMATSIVVYACAAGLALTIWARIRDLQVTRMLRAA